MNTLLQGAKVYIDGRFVTTDVLVSDGNIYFSSKESDFSELSLNAEVFDFTNKYIFPGFADMHVHFREPGFLYKEDIKSGSEAAAAGGYTTVCTMPNLLPVPDCRLTLNEELKCITDKAVINVIPFGSVTKGESGQELSAFAEMEECIGFSDDGVGVVNDELMRQAMTYAAQHNKIISAHCEYKSLMGGKNIHDGVSAERLGFKGISSESEWKMIERDLRLARETGCKYHVCHISTKESVELIRKAKAEGVDVTCETGPHYLLLNDEAILDETDGKDILSGMPLEIDRKLVSHGIGRLKMNPPIRSESDRRALIEGLLDGTVDMIATDHAPHSDEEKMKGLEGPMGVVGLECAFPVLYTYLVKTGLITLERLIELMNVNPLKRFEINNNNGLTVYDLDAEYYINPDEFKSKGRYTPFEGVKVNGKCLMTICNGRIVYNHEH